MNLKDPPLENLLSEYESVVAEAGSPDDDGFWEHLTVQLVNTCEWSAPTAEHLTELVRSNGSFVLRNAYALALALGIEDGDLGI